jgi:hypothetical protein
LTTFSAAAGDEDLVALGRLAVVEEQRRLELLAAGVAAQHRLRVGVLALGDRVLAGRVHRRRRERVASASERFGTLRSIVACATRRRSR